MEIDYRRFQWRDTGHGSWVRDADEAETFYAVMAEKWKGSGRSFFHMTGHLSLRVRVPESESRDSLEQRLDIALSKAWLALRFHHPLIASQVKLDLTRNRYVKEYPVNPGGWLEETFVSVSTGQTGVEWANNDPPAPLLPILNVISPPVDDNNFILRDLVFRSPHDIIDGIGTLLLLDNFIRLAAEALEHAESYEPPSLQDPRILENLSPPFRVAAAVPPRPSETITRRLENIAAAEKADAIIDADVVVLPYKIGATVPGVHKRVEVKLPSAHTSKLAVACKNLGVTVTHAFHAALVLALRDLQPQSDGPRLVQYVGYLLRNERSNCVPPYNDHRHPTGVYHSASGEKLIVKMKVPGELGDKKSEFLLIVRQIKDFYTSVRDDPEHYALAPYLWARSTPPLPNSSNTSTATSVPLPSKSPSASISSMGRIDTIIAHNHGPIEIYNPWVTGEELRNGLGLFLGTFREHLSLSAAYNDAWHDRADVIEFLRCCVDVVDSGLGI
ncbi:hypothetical protein VTK73DRAFT_8057 [Phialemonium thermophilum]|uniref:Condensation domain-containing protein n=1 Tax=Phialemonium thermophilum TaxID=223376 RepID=A0ABR3XQT8_9PEZI